jgi:hypothetical protein
MKNELLLKCCSTCKIEKPLNDFSNIKRWKNGNHYFIKHYNCLVCKRIKANTYNKVWNKSDKSKTWKKQYLKSYRQTDTFKNIVKKYQKSSENFKTYMKKYRSLDTSKKNKCISERKDRVKISNRYTKLQLTRNGFTNEQIEKYPELIETKREIIKIKRLCKI